MNREAGFTKIPISAYGVLSADEGWLYGYLAHRQGKNQTSWWSQKAIAQSLNWSPRKVMRVSSSLVSKGWLSKQRAPSKNGGWGVNHYRVLNPFFDPNTGQKQHAICTKTVTLNRTKKNNKQKQASALAPRFVVDEVLSLDKPNLDKPNLDKPNLDKPNLDKPQTKSALERATRAKPFPDLSELLSALPKGVQGQITATSTLGDLLAQLMITQNRSLAELKIWLGDPALWEGKRNAGGFLTSLLKKHLEIGYTPKEITPTPLAFNPEEFLHPESVPMPVFVKELRERLKGGL